MRIYSGRYEQLLREKAEYDRKNNEYDNAMDVAWRKYESAKDDIIQPIVDKVKQGLEKFNLLEIEVSGGTRYGENIEIEVKCNEISNRKESHSLRWTYDVWFNRSTNEVEQESNSWSGVNLTTPDQLADLKQTVQAVEFLQSLDWASMLSQELPNRRDFTEGIERPDNQYRDFTSELKEAKFDECVGEQVAIRGYATETSGYRENTKGYYVLTGATPKQYKCYFIADWSIAYVMNRDNCSKEEAIATLSENVYEFRIRKDTLVNISDKLDDAIVEF